jgi:hypothetical protein
MFLNTNNTYTEVISSRKFNLTNDKDVGIHIIRYFLFKENHADSKPDAEKVGHP